jgi:WD40 repeat protein
MCLTPASMQPMMYQAWSLEWNMSAGQTCGWQVIQRRCAEARCSLWPVSNCSTSHWLFRTHTILPCCMFRLPLPTTRKISPPHPPPTPPPPPPGHTKEGYGLAWSHLREGYLLSGSYDSRVCLWDVNAATHRDGRVGGGTERGGQGCVLPVCSLGMLLLC